MKQLYLLPLSLLLASAVFSQQNSEFGFAVNAGSFTLPAHGNTESAYMKETFHPGTSFSFGVFTQKHLGGHFGISAEILYNFSAYRMQDQFRYSGTDGYRFESNTSRHFDVQSFMFPVKIHFRINNGGKFSLHAGATPTFLLGSNVQTNYDDYSGYAYSTKEKDRVVREDGSEGIQLLFTAGGQYRIHPNTSVGLEFTGRFQHNTNEQNYYLYPDSFGCFVGVEPSYTYWMKSLTISLRHNILR